MLYYCLSCNHLLHCNHLFPSFLTFLIFVFPPFLVSPRTKQPPAATGRNADAPSSDRKAPPAATGRRAPAAETDAPASDRKPPPAATGRRAAASATPKKEKIIVKLEKPASGESEVSVPFKDPSGGQNIYWEDAKTSYNLLIILTARYVAARHNTVLDGSIDVEQKAFEDHLDVHPRVIAARAALGNRKCQIKIHYIGNMWKHITHNFIKNMPPAVSLFM